MAIMQECMKQVSPRVTEAIATMLRPIAIILTLETSILSVDLVQEVVKEYMRRYHFPMTFEGQRVDLRYGNCPYTTRIGIIQNVNQSSLVIGS